MTGENAMSPSDLGNGSALTLLRTNCSLFGPTLIPGKAGFHSVAGTSAAVSSVLRGPVRRSSSPAIKVRQLPLAICRSAAVISICISFSASAKVVTDTSGPTAGALPNTGGAPAVEAASCVVCPTTRPAPATANKPNGALIKN